MLNKINSKIQSLISQIEDLKEHGYDTREDKIVVNIKVYDYISSTDVENIISDLNYTEGEKEAVRQEFDEDRLNSIWEHTRELGVEYWKEKYEQNVDLTNFERVFQVYGRERMDKDSDFYFDEYSKKASKYKTKTDWVKYICKKHKQESEEFFRRRLIDFDCWQYGRSGGWFSICKEKSIEFDYGYCSSMFFYSYNPEQYLIPKTDEEFNELFKEQELQYKDKVLLVKELTDMLKSIKEQRDAIDHVISALKEEVKGFKEYSLLYRLNEEIMQFKEEELTDIDSANVEIKVDYDQVVTSLGVSVRMGVFAEALNRYLPKFKEMQLDEVISIREKVEHYFVNQATKVQDDVIIKAGCHRFSLNQINSIFGELSTQ